MILLQDDKGSSRPVLEAKPAHGKTNGLTFAPSMLSLWYSQILPRAETALSVAMILSTVRELGSLIVALSLCKAAARNAKKKPQFQNNGLRDFTKQIRIIHCKEITLFA